MQNMFTLALVGFLLLSGCSSSDTTTLDPGDTGTPTDPVALDEIAQPLLVSLAGYQADQLVFQIDDFAAAISSSDAGVLLEPAQIQTEFLGNLLTTPTERTSYNCDGGGQMIHEASRLREGLNTESSYFRNVDAYLFDQCMHSSTNTALPNGNYELSGSVLVDDYDRVGSRISENGYISNWTNFSMQGPAGLSYEVSGKIEVKTSTFDPGDFQLREVALDHYQKQLDGQTVELLQNVVFNQNFTANRSSGRQSYTLNVDGSYQGPLAGGKLVTVNTDPVLARVLAFGTIADQAQPFSGQVQISADDGGELLLSANATGDSTSTLFVDSAFMTSTGDTISSELIPLAEISIQAPGCTRTHDVGSGDLGCLDGQQYVIP